MDLDRNPANDTKKRVIKVIIVGDMGTGKTSIIRQYVQGAFSEFYKSTIGVDFAHKKLTMENGDIIDLQLWDISGQERFANVTHMYYNEAVASIIVFDLFLASSLDTALLWKADIDEKVFTSDEKPIPCLLVGNKMDIISEQGWGKTDEEMEQFCKEKSFIGFEKTSARNNINVADSIEKLVHHVLDNNIQPYRPKEVDTCVDINRSGKAQNKENGGCC